MTVERGHMGVTHRPLQSGRGAAPLLLFAPSNEGAERRMALGNVGHLNEGAACRVTGTRAFRRSTAAIFYAITVLLRSDRWGLPTRDPGSIGAAVRPNRVQPLKATPSSGVDGDRASRDEVTSPACRRRHPGSADRTSP